MEKQTTNIFSDGGARGNPGPGACAFIIRRGEKTLTQNSKYLGKVTNNYAEYSGVILALNWLIINPKIINTGEQINFFMDSELVINQINGKYKVKNMVLKKLNQEIRELIDKNRFRIMFKRIPRGKNKAADFLVNRELDNHIVL